ncbi:MAG TPA: fibronectin type III domain-containing protein [Clostridia bacterium]|nr:fibronectin type III domain-containing protein [Clostridia bacterium]
MGKKILAVLLVACCIFIFAGCTTTEKGFAEILNTMGKQGDFSYQGTTHLGVSNTIYAKLFKQVSKNLADTVDVTLTYSGVVNAAKGRITFSADVSSIGGNLKGLRVILENDEAYVSENCLISEGVKGYPVKKIDGQTYGVYKLQYLLDLILGATDSEQAQAAESYLKDMPLTTGQLISMAQSFLADSTSKDAIDSMGDFSLGDALTKAAGSDKYTLLLTTAKVADLLEQQMGGAGDPGFEDWLSEFKSHVQFTLNYSLEKVGSSAYNHQMSFSLHLLSDQDSIPQKTAGQKTLQNSMDFSSSASLTTYPVSMNTQQIATTLTSGELVLNVSGHDIQNCGILYSTSPKMTNARRMNAAYKGGKYIVDLSGLSPNTVYYYQTFATNKSGDTLYSATSTFKTKAPAPNPNTGSSDQPYALYPAALIIFAGVCFGVIRKKASSAR